MQVSKIIKDRRIQKAMSQDDVARAAGLSWNEYFDIELHSDEAFVVTPLSQLKTLCRVLDLPLLELVGEPCSICSAGSPQSHLTPIARHLLIRDHRERHGLSQEELAERLGYENMVIVEMERNEEYLEQLTIEEIRALSRELDAPMDQLLGLDSHDVGRDTT
jgi:transcriptional regulator with XRE-family HTH domain